MKNFLTRNPAVSAEAITGLIVAALLIGTCELIFAFAAGDTASSTYLSVGVGVGMVAVWAGIELIRPAVDRAISRLGTPNVFACEADGCDVTITATDTTADGIARLQVLATDHTLHRKADA